MAKKPATIRLPWSKKPRAPEAPLAAQAPAPIPAIPDPQRVVLAVPDAPTSPASALLEDGRATLALAGLAFLGVAAVADRARRTSPAGTANQKRLDQKAYKAYIVDRTVNKIASGWEYAEDAKSERDDNLPAPKNRWLIRSRAGLATMGLDPAKNEHWIGTIAMTPEGERAVAAPEPEEGETYLLLYEDGRAAAFTLDAIEDDGSFTVEDFDDARGEGGGPLSRDAWDAQVYPFPGVSTWERWRKAGDGTNLRRAPAGWIRDHAPHLQKREGARALVVAQALPQNQVRELRALGARLRELGFDSYADETIEEYVTRPDLRNDWPLGKFLQDLTRSIDGDYANVGEPQTKHYYTDAKKAIEATRRSLLG